LAHSHTDLTRDVVVTLLSAPALNAEGADDTTITLDDDKIVFLPRLIQAASLRAILLACSWVSIPYRF
jgi:hypothetical protein